MLYIQHTLNQYSSGILNIQLLTTYPLVVMNGCMKTMDTQTMDLSVQIADNRCELN